ncbi:carotenoid biosynthesis protein [Lactiplantibacillus mudanjiangensis]|uniref:Carotenoid biosynthesis protein n=1 Tax=Lactiplantibacillus mudanjiangensis TaxID=1296538 RepID=A0A660DU63_9LACO|nr:carotenoid biosynthesis protein [Lactiplantibacillus mudanjiangensis]VDG22721.1 hypothetical protein MUDAN_IGPPGNFN_00262 [Lactiplantibacillus mudanjiangensis]VDG26742.1 hypothetical protein MUDAN_MDHGFNIF_00146 [Lactiplantibacillus mudanjiangensis]
MGTTTKTKTMNRIVWSIIILDAVLTLFKEQLPVAAAAGLTILCYLVFSVAKGTYRLGKRDFWVFFGITFVVSWLYETLSIHTGFPFGHYYYTSSLGPKLGDVPLLIMPAYFGMGYASWQLAHLLTDHLKRKLVGRDLVWVPAIAAFIMVMWDLSMDPISSTMQHAWIWQNGGGYFGVPLVNFLGWYLCVYTIFQLFAWYQHRMTPNAALEQSETHRGFWWQVIIFYAFQAIAKILAMFSVNSTTVKDLAKVSWQTGDIYQGIVVVIIFTMVFVSVMAIDRLYRLLPKHRV